MAGSSEEQVFAAPFKPSEQQALAVFNHAAQEIRFFKDQQWRVTNYALLAYGALVAAPELIDGSKDLANWGCAGIAVLAAAAAGVVLWKLDKAHKKERDRMDEVRLDLPLVKKIHDKFPSGDGNRRTGRLVWAFSIALGIGLLLAIAINVSRAPSSARLLACISQAATGGP
jgi:hypothetical protein